MKGHFKKDGTWIKPYRRRGPRRGSVTTAVAVGGIVTAAIFGAMAGGASEPDVKTSTRPSDVAVSGDAQAGFRRAEAALSASGYKAILETHFDSDCVAHSYGKVREFFQANPCQWLARAYVQLGDSEILVAISWVGMPDASSAGDYKDLVDAPDAGGVTQFSRDTTLYRNIKYTGSVHMSGVKGTAVWKVEVKPVFPARPGETDKILAYSRQ